MHIESKGTQNTGGLCPEYKTYKHQKCFIGHSNETVWRDDLLSACEDVLPQFDLEPWYAADHFDPTKPLRDKVVQLIANARYGIYDLSSWQDKMGQWHLPRNVFIELGMAIALNRPTLLLRHTSNKALSLPKCLEGLHLIEFSGDHTLKKALKAYLPQWLDVSPDRDWLNRFCIFGNRACDFREAHPRARQWGHQTVCCHLTDGLDKDHPDFQVAEQDEIRGVFEDVFGRYSDLDFTYLDELSLADGYQFLLCSQCQTVRFTPFAVYRILPHTPAEVFVAIGMSIALETLFEYDIPKVVLVRQERDLPSLLRGYEVVEVASSNEAKKKLRAFIPLVMQKTRETAWKPRPLPFVEVTVLHSPENKSSELEDDSYIWRYADLLDNVAQVIRSATAVLDIEVLLQETIRLICERLNVYHAAVFLLGESQEYLVLRAVYPRNDQRLLDPGVRLRVGQGIIGWVAHQRKAYLAPDVLKDPLYLLNLPDARAEMAFPLIAQEELIGVLDVQSNKTDDLQEKDIIALQPLADQLANAIHNIQQNREAIDPLSSLNRAGPHLVRIQGEPEVYLISENVRHLIPDGPTLEVLADWNDVVLVSQQELEDYENGIAIPSIAQGETERVEFKLNLRQDPSELAKDIAAFANSGGGTILYGVTDDRRIVGITDFESQRSAFMNRINQAGKMVKPTINTTIQEIKIGANNSLIILIVPSSEQFHTVEGMAYVRVGGQRQEVDQFEKKTNLSHLLADVFTYEELTVLCFDEFPPVYKRFKPGTRNKQRIRLLLDHCTRHNQIEKLLALIRERHPSLYAQFEGRLRQ